MKKKIGIVSLGCPKNLVDSEIMLGLLKKEDFEITHHQDEAEVIIVNTCGFIDAAKQESIDTILEMAKLKEERCELLIVTGCLAERYKDQIAMEIPEVDAVLGTGNYSDISQIIERAYQGEKVVLYGKLSETSYLENERILSTGKGFAYIKISEGCDNCCTYCVIPSLRGRYRSRKREDILKEAARLVEEGVREVILIAQDTTRYGLDIYKEKKLVDLIKELSALEGLEWVRILYCYPEEIDDGLMDEMAQNCKVCKYLDIPIQHSSDKVLRSMGRRGTGREVRDLIIRLRERIPGIVLRTSLIVGFPGEDEEDFRNLYQFVDELKFDRLGVFMYSKEEGTPAAKMKQQVGRKVKENRYDRLMSLQKNIIEGKNRERLNKQYKTMVEGVSEDGIFYYGRTYAEAPDIDNLIYFVSSEPLEKGSFVNVKILDMNDYDLIGEVVNESSQ